MKMTRFALPLLLAAILAACSSGSGGSNTRYEYPTMRPGATQTSIFGQEEEGLLGPGGLSLLGGDDEEQRGGPGIGVNAFLWRASLDTVSFMPVASADPFGGVIITDWYSPPENQNERYKINLYILDRTLRADGVRASIFRQRRATTGQWVDVQTDPGMGSDLENTILTRARQLRVASAQR
ncbi:hypothetical protein AUP43_00425 [Oceanibaculum pacificum]|uniref:DUF3576 domain-containing protein n=2 Tax=Oceanibaculum pacificum TaxID=580166 RepID=A0A154WH53_9PROT|nr:hypothetical protein AUP43_00425 [Oceanibaculum pacificum]